MSADFILSFSAAFLNRASQSVFPAIQPKMSRSGTIPSMQLTVSWGVSAPPQFQFTGAGGGQMFTLTMPLDVTTTPDGGPSQQGTSDVVASCRAIVVAAGSVQFSVADISFTSADPFLQAVLNAKKADITAQVNDFVSTLAIQLNVIDGVHFAGYALQIGQGQGAAAGGLQMPVTIPPTPGLSTDFAAYISQPLLQYIVQTTFWAQVPKDYSASGADVHLNGYEAGLANGQLWLNLHLSGTYSSAGADWDIDIGTVNVNLNIAVDGRSLVIRGGDVSRPSVSLNPSNWLAWVYTIGGGIVTAIITAILNDVIGGKIQDSIRGNLNRTLMDVPVLNGAFEGVNITLTPRDLAVAGQGSQLVLTGNADVTAS
ncbi:MAG: hypothetical protein ACK4K7_10760 [Allosphingosinicella sp.]|uniref:hypothetical protein n=1 Tax=Allosphingosinicella sp. TaxID=2823234 RepID=UPI003926FFEE